MLTNEELAGSFSQPERVFPCNTYVNGLLRELNPGPLAPEARIIPLDQAAMIAVDIVGADAIKLAHGCT